MMNKKTEQWRNACVGATSGNRKTRAALQQRAFLGCFRLRWMASSSAEASADAKAMA